MKLIILILAVCSITTLAWSDDTYTVNADCWDSVNLDECSDNATGKVVSFTCTSNRLSGELRISFDENTMTHSKRRGLVKKYSFTKDTLIKETFPPIKRHTLQMGNGSNGSIEVDEISSGLGGVVYISKKGSRIPLDCEVVEFTQNSRARSFNSRHRTLESFNTGSVN